MWAPQVELVMILTPFCGLFNLDKYLDKVLNIVVRQFVVGGFFYDEFALGLLAPFFSLPSLGGKFNAIGQPGKMI